MEQDEDILLWQRLCAEVKPLSHNGAEPRIVETQKQKVEPAEAPLVKKSQDRLFGDNTPSVAVSAQDLLRPQYKNRQQKNRAKIQHDSPKTFTELDGRRAQRFRSGKLKPDAVLDLHGLREHEAAEDFARFFARALRQKHRCLLVVTGKGSGVLHRALARWLENPSIRRNLAGVSAMPAHKGGSGAYGLYLRN